jgi:hypothetical protein
MRQTRDPTWVGEGARPREVTGRESDSPVGLQTSVDLAGRNFASRRRDALPFGRRNRRGSPQQIPCFRASSTTPGADTGGPLGAWVRTHN